MMLLASQFSKYEIVENLYGMLDSKKSYVRYISHELRYDGSRCPSTKEGRLQQLCFFESHQHTLYLFRPSFLHLSFPPTIHSHPQTHPSIYPPHPPTYP